MPTHAQSYLLAIMRYILIDNTQNSNTLTNYQIPVNLDTASLISAGKMRSDCGDIRFYDSDGATPLNYWIEGQCNSSSTLIWVKVPSIPASSKKTIYLYYGNPSYTSLSNFANTMITLSSTPKFGVTGDYYATSNNTQSNPQYTLVPDGQYGYLSTYDVWSAHDEGAYWVFDFGSVASRAYRIKWYMSATAVSNYCVNFSTSFSLSTDGANYTQLYSNTLTATGSTSVTITEIKGSARFLMISQYSNASCMVANGYTYVDAVYARAYSSPEPSILILPESYAKKLPDSM